MVALNVVLAHLFAQLLLFLKAKLNTKSTILASIAVLANPYVLRVLSLPNNSDRRMKKGDIYYVSFFIEFLGVL